jgi:hypothetical protein
MEMFDASIDGVADAGKGRVRAITATLVPTGNDLRIVSGATDQDGTAEWSTGHHGMIYYFDRDPSI